jgi:hypothetical protein
MHLTDVIFGSGTMEGLACGHRPTNEGSLGVV